MFRTAGCTRVCRTGTASNHGPLQLCNHILEDAAKGDAEMTSEKEMYFRNSSKDQRLNEEWLLLLHAAHVPIRQAPDGGTFLRSPFLTHSTCHQLHTLQPEEWCIISTSTTTSGEKLQKRLISSAFEIFLIHSKEIQLT